MQYITVFCVCPTVEGVAQRPAAMLGDGVRCGCRGAARVGRAGSVRPSDGRSHRQAGERNLPGHSLIPIHVID